MPEAWYWDANTARYRAADGTFFARAKVLSYVSQSIDASSSVTATLSHYVVGGQLNATDWRDIFRQELKEEHIRQYLLAIGGMEQMTPRKWSSIGGMLRDQYRHLDNLYDEVLTGTLSEAEIRARMAMYIHSSREAFERASAIAAKTAKKTQERWVLGTGEHCGGCLALADMGWQPIGSLPFPGQGKTPCLTNCNCHKEYR